MTKQLIVNAMMKRALKLQKKYSAKGYDQIWEMAYDFNSSHADEEIFLCEDEIEGTEDGVRLYIEDYYFDLV